MIKVLALGLSFPSVIFTVSYVCWLLVGEGMMARRTALLVWSAVTVGGLFGIVYYAFEFKKRH